MKVVFKKAPNRIGGKPNFKLSRRRRLIATKEAINTSVIPSQPRLPRTVVKLNLSGNRRGMHNVDRPPSSEHMRKIRAMRRFYNKQMPVLQCSSCSFASSCPKFKSGYECAFIPFLNSHRIQSEGDLVESMQELCTTGMRRAHLQTIMETLTGATPSLEVSESLNLVFAQLKALHELTSANGSMTIETEDATIIGQLFGGLDKLIEHTKIARENPIVDLPAVKALPAPVESDSVLDAVMTNPNVNFDLIRAHSKHELESSIGSKVPEIQVGVLK